MAHLIHSWINRDVWMAKIIAVPLDRASDTESSLWKKQSSDLLRFQLASRLASHTILWLPKSNLHGSYSRLLKRTSLTQRRNLKSAISNNKSMSPPSRWTVHMVPWTLNLFRAPPLTAMLAQDAHSRVVKETKIITTRTLDTLSHGQHHLEHGYNPSGPHWFLKLERLLMSSMRLYTAISCLHVAITTNWCCDGCPTQIVESSKTWQPGLHWSWCGVVSIVRYVGWE